MIETGRQRYWLLVAGDLRAATGAARPDAGERQAGCLDECRGVLEVLRHRHEQLEFFAAGCSSDGRDAWPARQPLDLDGDGDTRRRSDVARVLRQAVGD